MPQPKNYRQQVIEYFRAACTEDDRIIASFIGGSFATGSTDEYSDLDLYAIIRNEAYDQFLSEHRDFFEDFSQPVFLEHFDEFGFDMFVFILVGGVQGELGIAKPDHFLHIHGGPFKVLVDKDGLLEVVEFPWQRPSTRQQLEQLRKHLNWFWRDLSLFSVGIGRGDLWTAAGYLQSMRLRCIHLLRLDKDFNSWSDGYEKLDATVQAHDLHVLEATFPRLDAQDMLKSANNLISFYRHLAPELADRHEVDYPVSAEQVVLHEFARASGFDY